MPIHAKGKLGNGHFVAYRRREVLTSVKGQQTGVFNGVASFHARQHEDAASFLFGIAKRCRKCYLGLTTITQDVADFMRS